MIIIELPVKYSKNYKEVEKGIEQGIEVVEILITDITTFIIPDDFYLRINRTSDNNTTTLHFSDNEAYTIDADYETILQIFKDAINKRK